MQHLFPYDAYNMCTCTPAILHCSPIRDALFATYRIKTQMSNLVFIMMHGLNEGDIVAWKCQVLVPVLHVPVLHLRVSQKQVWLF